MPKCICVNNSKTCNYWANSKNPVTNPPQNDVCKMHYNTISKRLTQGWVPIKILSSYLPILLQPSGAATAVGQITGAPPAVITPVVRQNARTSRRGSESPTYGRGSSWDNDDFFSNDNENITKSDIEECFDADTIQKKLFLIKQKEFLKEERKIRNEIFLREHKQSTFFSYSSKKYSTNKRKLFTNNLIISKIIEYCNTSELISSTGMINSTFMQFSKPRFFKISRNLVCLNYKNNNAITKRMKLYTKTIRDIEIYFKFDFDLSNMEKEVQKIKDCKEMNFSGMIYFLERIFSGLKFSVIDNHFDDISWDEILKNATPFKLMLLYYFNRNYINAMIEKTQSKLDRFCFYIKNEEKYAIEPNYHVNILTLYKEGATKKDNQNYYFDLSDGKQVSIPYSLYVKCMENQINAFAKQPLNFFSA